MSKYDDRIKIRCIVSTQTINHIVNLDKKSNGILRDVEVTDTVPKKYYIKE